MSIQGPLCKMSLHMRKCGKDSTHYKHDFESFNNIKHFCKKIIKRFKLRPKNKFIPDLKNYIDKPYIDKKKKLYTYIYIYSYI